MAGIDIFESDYPLSQAALGLALQIEAVDGESAIGDAQNYLTLSRGMQTKTQRVFDLSKEEFKASKEPMAKGCTCHTCKNYNQAYIYHMLEVKEMNANILLAIHNVWQYDLLFQMIRANLGKLGHFAQAYVEKNCVDK